jgi:hypothetical protein
MKILFVYKYFLKKGGFPQELSSFINGLPNLDTIDVICECSDGDIVINSKINNIFKVNTLFDIIKLNVKNYNFVIFVTYSSMYNFLISVKVFSKYIIIPYSQINSFLDYDNIVEKNVAPVIKKLEKKEEKENYSNDVYFSRVKNGKKDLGSYLRALKRKIYRKTIGNIFLKRSSAIGVLSIYEKNMINSLYPANRFKYIYYKFGSVIKEDNIGSDRLYTKNNLIKLVIWSRVDFYYKGIDRILNIIRKLKINNKELMFKLFIVGPSYNNGYEKIKNYVIQNKLNRYVKLIVPGEYTSGTFGILASSDMSVCLSRWDGYPRTLRESLLLNIPILASEEANFDIPINDFKCGIVIKSQEELKEFLENISFELLREMENNFTNITNYFSWETCANEFIDQLKILKS